jgi:hypothetical protein
MEVNAIVLLMIVGVACFVGGFICGIVGTVLFAVKVMNSNKETETISEASVEFLDEVEKIGREMQKSLENAKEALDEAEELTGGKKVPEKMH